MHTENHTKKMSKRRSAFQNDEDATTGADMSKRKHANQ